MSENWYTRVDADTPLTQGDLISDCPLIGWDDRDVNVSGADEAEVLKGVSKAIRADVVVMTQACDLENRKVANAILCPHVSIAEFKKSWDEAMDEAGQTKTPRAWQSYCDNIRNGFIWNLTILNEGEVADLKIEPRIVDFRDVYTIPRRFLESLLTQRGRPRLRLNPPYREHLSQAFARFFMRVGLPIPVKKAW